MKFVFNKNDLRTLARAEENCYLITNGLGGFSSLTIASSCARGDQTLFMAALTAPNKRYQLIANTIEKLYIDGEEYLYLSNSEDETDVMFRKVDKTDRDFIIPLDNEEEVIKVAKAFNEKQ